MVGYKHTKQEEKKNKIVQVCNFKYLCLHIPSLLSRSVTKQEEIFISALAGLYTLMECPLQTCQENNQVKNVDLVTKKS